MPDLPLSTDVARAVLDVDDALRTWGTPYAFGGAIALAYHVRRPRGTADIDVNLAAPAPATAGLLHLLPDVDWDDRTLEILEREGWVRVWLEGDIALGWTAELLGEDSPSHRRLLEMSADG